MTVRIHYLSLPPDWLDLMTSSSSSSMKPLDFMALPMSRVHLSAQPEPFLSLKLHETTKRVPQKVLTVANGEPKSEAHALLKSWAK